MSEQAAQQTVPKSTGPLTFETESLPGFSVDEAFDFDIQAVGGTPPYNFELTEGSLPDGIELSTDGNLSGTPTEAGDVTAFIKLSDAAGAELTQAFDCQVS